MTQQTVAVVSVGDGDLRCIPGSTPTPGGFRQNSDKIQNTYIGDFPPNWINPSPSPWVQPQIIGPYVPYDGYVHTWTSSNLTLPHRFNVSTNVDGELELTLDLPGVRASSLDVSIVDGNKLQVLSTRETFTSKNESTRIDTYEFGFGVDVRDIEANFDLCVLHVRVKDMKNSKKSVFVGSRMISSDEKKKRVKR